MGRFFNVGKADEITSLYHKDAINHQVANEPIIGKKAIHEMFKSLPHLIWFAL